MMTEKKTLLSKERDNGIRQILLENFCCSAEKNNQEACPSVTLHTKYQASTTACLDCRVWWVRK